MWLVVKFLAIVNKLVIKLDLTAIIIYNVIITK